MLMQLLSFRVRLFLASMPHPSAHTLIADPHRFSFYFFFSFFIFISFSLFNGIDATVFFCSFCCCFIIFAGRSLSLAKYELSIGWWKWLWLVMAAAPERRPLWHCTATLANRLSSVILQKMMMMVLDAPVKVPFRLWWKCTFRCHALLSSFFSFPFLSPKNPPLLSSPPLLKWCRLSMWIFLSLSLSSFAPTKCALLFSCCPCISGSPCTTTSSSSSTAQFRHYCA